MASSKISELVDGTNLQPGDKTIILRNGANFKVDPTVNAVNAWVNANASTDVINGSYNVSSVTDLGAGRIQVNFTNAITDANYAAVGTIRRTDDSTGNPYLTGSRNHTTSSVEFIIIDYSGTETDNGILSAVIVR